MLISSQRRVRLVYCAILFLILPAVTTSVSSAKVACIRLTSEHNADTTDLGRFRQYSEWKDKTGNELAIAVWKYLCGYETGLYHFKEIYKSSVPAWTNHWRCNWDTDVVLDKHAEQVYVKYSGDPGLNTIRACLHMLPKQPSKTGLRITHGFSTNGRLQTKTIDLDKPDDYTIECDGEPENVFIEMTVPSGRKL